MSNKNKNDFIRACAFWGILISATLFVVGGILNWLGGISNIFPTIASICNLIAAIAIVIAIAIPAWDWVKYKKVGWKVTFWIALVIYVFGVVFGMIPAFRG